MKKKLGTIIIVICMTVAPLLLTAQNPPHPNGGNTPNAGNHPVGTAAPIGSGLAVLLSLGAAYGARSIYSIRTKLSAE